LNFIHSIKFRFTLWYLAVLFVLLILLSTGVYFVLLRNLNQNLNDSLEQRAVELSRVRNILTSIGEQEFQEELGETISLYFYTPKGGLTQITARDVEVPYNSEIVEEAIDGRVSFATVKTGEGEKLRLCAVPFSPTEGPGFFPGMMQGMNPGTANVEWGALVVGRSTEEMAEALRGLVRILIIAIPLTMIVAGGGGLFLARRALKPVDNIAQTARDIGESDLSRRINVNTRDELGRLSSILNQMIERMEKAFKRQRQFTSDASHELRTPLAVIKAETTLALEKERTAEEYRRSLETVSQEADSMSAVINQLLMLARADAGKEQLLLEEVNLRDLLNDMESDIRILCQEKGLEFHQEQMENLTVRGDRSRLRQLFLNMFNNAIRYTPAGGRISASLTSDRQMAVVAITDTGIGIPEKEIPLIFERFYRVDKAHSRAEGGSGLGLAICLHIAEAHGGRIEVKSEVGAGSTFTVSLPLYDHS